MSFAKTQRHNAIRWKTHSCTLPEAARVAAPYVDKGAEPGVTEYPFCLPVEYADFNLLPEIRAGALAIFAELGIPWHAGVREGPTNHLLSSQVQCVNALTSMVSEPDRINAAFGHVVDIQEVLQIEPGRFLTFEYIGPVGKDYLHEAKNGILLRGAHCTSIDAAFRFRNGTGLVELALVEWKYTESYRRRAPNRVKDAVRAGRYEDLYQALDGPVHNRVPLHLLFDEPFYQLLRQQLLASELERHRVAGAEIVRVLHVLDPANVAYQTSIAEPAMKELGDTVDEIWSFLLKDSARFRHVDPAVFLNPAITSAEYAARYSGGVEPE
jgi:hypothetical protein